MFEALLDIEMNQLALELSRLSGLIVVTPVPWEVAPKQVKAGMVLLLALLIHGVSPAMLVPLDGPLDFALYIVSEFAIGAAMGFVVRLSVSVAEIAGNTIAPVIGFGAAQVFDPATGQQDTVLSKLFRHLFLFLALLVGLHRVVLGALLRSFQELPLASAVRFSESAGYFIELSARALLSGVRLSLPVLSILLMIQLALGFVSRAAPAMQIFSVGFAVLLLVGGLAVFLALPDMAREMIGEMSRVASAIETLLTMLSNP